jgi:NDP-sugar pyrophosphorylase family protein
MPGAEAGAPAPLMFTGIHIMEPRIFEYIPRGVFSDSVTNVYPQAIANGETIASHVAAGKWRELSTLRRYLDICVELLRESGRSFVAGANADISGEVVDSILWDDVVVGNGAKVTRAVLADHVKIAAGEVIDNAVVVPRMLVDGKTRPEKALPGEFRGENFVVPL